MAIQPSPRSAGSSHVLRFVGNIVISATPNDPGNAELAAAPTALEATTVRFYLADLTALTNGQRSLPAGSYDDSAPAGDAPHDPTVPGGPVSTPNPSGMTWSQNVQARVQETENPHATLIARVDVLKPLSAYDPNNDVPYVDLDFYFAAAGVALLGSVSQPGVGVPVVVEIEVPHTVIR